MRRGAGASEFSAMKLLRLFVAAAALGSALLAVAAPALQLPRALPADTTVVFYVRNVPELLANWEHSPGGKAWQDPEMRKFFAPTVRFLEEDKAGNPLHEFRKSTGLEPRELLELFPGEVALAILRIDPYLRDEEKNDPQMVLLAQIGANRAKIEELVRKGREKSGEHEVDEEFQGETLHLIVKADAESGAQRPAEGWAIVGDTFVMAEPKAVLQQIVANLKRGGAPDSLAASEEFAAIFARQPDTGFTAFFNAEACMGPILEHLRATGGANPGANPLGLTPDDIMRHLGLDALRSLSFSFAMTRENSAGELRLGWRERRGLWRILALGEPPVNLPAEMPETWASVAAGRFSIGEMYRAIMDTLRAAAPALEGGARQQIANLNKQLGVDLERDLIGSFGDEFFTGENPAVGPDGQPNLLRPTNQLIGISLADAAKFTRTLETLKGMLPPAATQMIASREYLGETINTVTPPTPGAPSVSYAITRSHLLVAVGDPGMIESVLQGRAGTGRSAWKKPEVVAALAELPPGYSAVGAYDLGRMMNMVFDILIATQGKAAADAPPPAEGEAEAAPAAPAGMQFVDPAARPSAEVIAKYWGTSASANYIDGTGLRVVFRLKHRE